MSDNANQTTTTPTPIAAEVLATAPPVRVEPGARERIRASHWTEPAVVSRCLTTIRPVPRRCTRSVS